jgi:hypothetical protein
MKSGGIRLGKKFELSLPEFSSSAVCELLEEKAPKTCEVIWKSLPIESNVLNAKCSGNEAYFPFEKKFTAPPENTIVYPIPGDCYYFQMPAGYEEEEREKQHMELMGNPRWSAGVSVVYGTTQFNMFGRSVAASLFARVIEDDGFLEALDKHVYRGGIQKIEARKIA